SARGRIRDRLHLGGDVGEPSDVDSHRGEREYRGQEDRDDDEGGAALIPAWLRHVSILLRSCAASKRSAAGGRVSDALKAGMRQTESFCQGGEREVESRIPGTCRSEATGAV